MALIKLENQNFDELLKDKIVLVDFYASWCGPCKMISPILEEMSSEVDFDIIKVDSDKHGEIARNYGVMSIPTLIVFKNKEVVNKHIGFATKDAIINLVNSSR
ncbi:MAG: thioredoxin [Bacilli bacterium]